MGSGLIGSAAAKYLATKSSEVLLIGVREPEDYRSAGLFSSHYDNSRVQRIIGWNSTWTRLSLESATQWPTLESQTGIKFHDPSGCLYLAPERDAYLQGAAGQAAEFQLHYQEIDDVSSLDSIAPELKFDCDVTGLYENAPAGSINPRSLVIAQQKAFAKYSGTQVEDMVVGVKRVNACWKISTKSGAEFCGKKVLIAAGSFSRFNSLLPVEIATEIKTEVVLNAEVNQKDAAALSHLPSLLYEIYADDFDGIYMVKPQLYPDGKWYIKMGLNQKSDIFCENLDELQSWFRGNAHSSYLPVLNREIGKLLPSVNFMSLKTKPCVISRTTSGNPYIDSVDEGLFIATGCQGYSAMSSDAQGRVAASLMHSGVYEAGYQHRDLAVVLKSSRT